MISKQCTGVQRAALEGLDQEAADKIKHDFPLRKKPLAVADRKRASTVASMFGPISSCRAYGHCAAKLRGKGTPEARVWIAPHIAALEKKKDGALKTINTSRNSKPFAASIRSGFALAYHPPTPEDRCLFQPTCWTT